MRTDTAYFAFKHSMKAMLGRVPVIGRGLKDRTRNAKDRVRRALLGDSIFESMGLDYLGPVDGHDEVRLEAVLREAKLRDRICVVHMVTEKGRASRSPRHRRSGIIRSAPLTRRSELSRPLRLHSRRCSARRCALSPRGMTSS